MQQLQSLVKIPEVVVKLHWPHWWCQLCGGETEVVDVETYMCVSCRCKSNGRTELIQGTIRRLS